MSADGRPAVFKTVCGALLRRPGWVRFPSIPASRGWNDSQDDSHSGESVQMQVVTCGLGRDSAFGPQSGRRIYDRLMDELDPNCSAGMLIAVEGIGGSGKSTLAARLVEWLTNLNMPVTASREPGATPLGAELRRLLLEGNFSPVPWADAFLFEADRAQTYATVIAPALAAGNVVVSDRNLYGTIAYQAFGSRLDLGVVDVMNRVATGGRYPDLILVVDVEPALALARKTGSQQKDRFDERALDFQVAARNGYLFAAGRDADRAHVIDGARSADAVFKQAMAIVEPALTSRGLLR
jgi:dTMP kinase